MQERMLLQLRLTGLKPVGLIGYPNTSLSYTGVHHSRELVELIRLK
jgi:hypothetical protein